MSVHGNYGGGLENPVPVAITLAATKTDIVTANDNAATLASFGVSNNGGGATVVQVYFYDGTTDFLIWVKSVADDTTEIVSDLPIALRDGDKIKAEAVNADYVTITPVIVREDTDAKSSTGSDT